MKDKAVITNSFDVSKYNWLITGGCGFIGTNLIAHLLKKNVKIRVLDNLFVGTHEDLARVCEFIELDSDSLSTSFPISNPNALPPAICTMPGQVQLVLGDIGDFNTCMKCCENMDIIIHLAASTGVGLSAENPRQDMETNVIGTFNLIEAARQNRVEKFVFASSSAPIGECEPPIHEELAAHPVSPYGASKLAGEAYCSAYFRTFGIDTVGLRFGNVYGPLSTHKNSVVAKFIKRAMEGKPLEIYGDGTQTRDFIFVDDLIRAILLSVSSRDVGGEIFQIATNSETTISELVERLLPILAAAGLSNVELRHIAPRLGDVRRSFSDTTKAERVLNWRAEVDILKGLELTLKWFMDNNKTNK